MSRSTPPNKPLPMPPKGPPSKPVPKPPMMGTNSKGQVAPAPPPKPGQAKPFVKAAPSSNAKAGAAPGGPKLGSGIRAPGAMDNLVKGLTSMPKPGFKAAAPSNAAKGAVKPGGPKLGSGMRAPGAMDNLVKGLTSMPKGSQGSKK